MMMIFSFLSSVYATGNSLDIQVDVYGKREDNQKTKLTILLQNISQEDKTLSSFQIHLPQQVVV